MALPRIRIGRALAYLAAIAISAFILAPIYLITISAFSSFDAVYEYPKNLLPSDLSMESMNIFLDSDGVERVAPAQRLRRVIDDRRVPRDRHARRLRARALHVQGGQSLPAGAREPLAPSRSSSSPSRWR